jgi:two-component system sensor histidine kinase/response regulator
MRLQKANRIITILAASLSLASVACVLVSGYFRHRQAASLNARTQSLLLSIQLAEGTDKLTAAARGFAATGDPRYRDVFRREVGVERNRDHAVEGLQALGLTQEENELVSRAKRNSDALIAQEEKAFEAAERKDFTKAMGYVYGEEYLKAKALIMDPIDEFRRRLDDRLAGQALSEERAAQRSVNLAMVAAVLTALAVGGALIFYRTKMVAPLVALGRSLSDLLARRPGIQIGFQEDRSEIGDIARSLESYKGLQEERNRATQQMHQLLEFTGQGIYGINLQGNCTFINRATCEMVGYRPEEALGRNMHDLVHHHKSDGSAYPLDQCPIYSAFKKGEGCRADDEVMWRKDGSPIPVEYSSFPILEDGKITGAVVTIVDITARKQAEEKLAEREKLFRSIFENAQIGISFFKIDSQEIFPNRALQEMLGYTEKALSRLEKWDEITHPGERDSSAERYGELVQGKREKNEWEQRLVHKDGRIVVTSVRFSLLRDTEGRPQYVAALQEDITERKRLEAEIVAAKEVAEAATKAKSDFLANMSHEIRTPMNAILGMTHLALKTDLTPKQRDYLTKSKAAAQSLLGIINDILDFSKIEAGKLDMEKTDFRLDDVLENLSSVVSQKAQDKKLEFLIAAQEDLPPNLVGDPLRLGQILINLANNAVKFTERGEILVTVAFDGKVLDRVNLKFSVRDSGIGMTSEQAARLFQAFSQADSSTTRKYGGTGLGLSISKKLVELMDGNIWVESNYGTGSTFHFTAWFGIGSGITKRRRLIPDIAGIRVLVVDDNEQAREILTDSLKGLALRVKSVSSGEAAIRELAAADSPDPYQLVMMDWHMPGMNGLEASQIIKKGDRLKHIPKLVMVTAFGQEDVRAQAEEIGIDSYLLKPVTPSALFDTLVELFGNAGEEADRSRVTRAITTSHDANGIRILLVEDNEVNQQVATELLESAGAIVRIANHGGEAVRILTEGEQPPPFDVVFMDLQMPDMDGFTATGLLRAQPQLQRLPIIAMTAHALVEERQRCLEAGMNDHVSKPIDPDALFATLLRWAKPRQGQAVDAEDRTAKLSNEVILPEIDGVDMAAGLKRIAGNKRLYLDLLLQFAAKQRDVPEQILSAIEIGDRKLAERIAHTVKGVAGNIGLGKVFVAAEKLERAIHEADAAAPVLVEEFVLVLSHQVEAIQQSMRDAMPDRPAEWEKGSELDVQAATAAIARLRVLLESSDGDAAEAFLSLASAFAGACDKLRMYALGEAISEFDFDSALLKLDEIAKDYGVNWEQAK